MWRLFSVEGGPQHRIKELWQPDIEDCVPDEIAMSFDNIVSAFAAVLLGTFVACAIALVEYMAPKIKRLDWPPKLC